MSLKAVYERFLSHPNPVNLSESAIFHYVTTLTSFTRPGAIIRHLENQNSKVCKKKTEKVIAAVEGHHSIALEVETTLEFLTDGGAYLPGLDSFVVDRTATIPITHFVYFDRDEKIEQIRLSWDQASLLKQVEVIGSRSKSWPVFDGKDQIKIIASGPKPITTPTKSSLPSRGRSDEQSEGANRNMSPSKKFIKDPHASLDVFDPPKEDENRRSATSGSHIIAPRESARPAPREHSELFAAGHEDLAPSPGGSPNKAYQENVVPPKGAGARKFQGSRMFQEDQDFHEPKIYKTNPARYNHFDLGEPDENDPMQHKTKGRAEKAEGPLIARAHKNTSHWDFDDFSTPAKATQRVRPEDQVHFSLDPEDERQKLAGKPGQAAHSRKDVEAHFDFTDDGTPVQKRPSQPKARKDADIHFELRDEPTPAPRRIIARTKAAQGIYSNPLDVDDEYGPEQKAPLANITNNAGRRKDFDSQWDSYDQSPEAAKKPVGAKSRSGLTSNWDFED